MRGSPNPMPPCDGLSTCNLSEKKLRRNISEQSMEKNIRTITGEEPPSNLSEKNRRHPPPLSLIRASPASSAAPSLPPLAYHPSLACFACRAKLSKEAFRLPPKFSSAGASAGAAGAGGSTAGAAGASAGGAGVVGAGVAAAGAAAPSFSANFAPEAQSSRHFSISWERVTSLSLILALNCSTEVAHAAGDLS